MGGVQFSLETAIPIRLIQFWTLAIKRRNKGTVSPQLWLCKKKAAGVTLSIKNFTDDKLHAELKKAKGQCRTAKKNHKQHRLSFLETLDPKDHDRLKKTEEQCQLG